MSIAEMTNNVRNLKELEAFISEAQAEAEAIKDEIKAQMTERERKNSFPSPSFFINKDK